MEEMFVFFMAMVFFFVCLLVGLNHKINKFNDLMLCGQMNLIKQINAIEFEVSEELKRFDFLIKQGSKS